MINRHIAEYRTYAIQTLPNAFLSALLACSLWQLYPPITGFLGFVAPYIPNWALPLAVTGLSSFGLWYINRENEKPA